MKFLKIVVPLVALLAVGFLYWPDQPSYIPQKLWGVWQADYEEYAGRYLDISEAIFTIGQGQENLQVFFIHHVEKDLAGPRERYTLYYRDHNKASDPVKTFTFFYDRTEAGERLQLKNPKNIFWYRNTRLEADVSGPETATP